MTEIAPQPSADISGSEVLTFLIADIRGYTAFTAREGDEAAAAATSTFADLVRTDVERNGGRLIELRGDEALSVFRAPRPALRAALHLQESLASAASDGRLPLGVGIGLDVGEAVPVGGGYRGSALNLAARLCAAAAAGEVLSSEALVHLAGRVPGVQYVKRGGMAFHGLAEPIGVVQIVPDDDARGRSTAAREPAVSRVDGRQLPSGAFLGSRPTSILVARETERSRLVQLVDQVVAGSGHLALLAGEPGVGKTRLAQEITIAARDRGFLLAASTCYEQRQGSPFYPIRELLQELRQQAPNLEPGGEDLPALDRLLSLRDEPNRAEAIGDSEALFRAIVNQIQKVAAQQPLVLAIDDLQWADQSTLEILPYLALQTRRHPVLILGTYRDDELDRDHPLHSSLLQLRRQHLVDELRIQRLPIDGTAALVESILDAADADRKVVELIHERTDGNPLFVTEMLNALIERGDLYRSDGSWQSRDLTRIEVPAGIRLVIQERIARLGPLARRVLAACSVLGREFSFDALLTIGGGSDLEIEAALEEASAAGLLQKTSQDHFGFQHGLIQQIVYDSLGPASRRRLHLAAAEALARTPMLQPERRAAEIAWHFLRGGDVGRGLPAALRAADEAKAVYAYAEAERLYRLAYEFAWQFETSEADGVRAHTEAEILEKLGRLLLTTGRYGESEDFLEQAIQAYAGLGNSDGELRSTAAIGMLLAYTNRTAEGIQRLEATAQSASAHIRRQPRSAAELYSSLSRLYLADHQYRAALEAAERAVQLAGETEDSQPAAGARIRKGEALALLGRHDEARRLLEETALTDRDSDAGMLAPALNGLGIACIFAGQFGHAEEYFSRSRDLYERQADPRGLATSTLNLAQVALLKGDWGEAEELFEKTQEAADAVGLRHFSASALAGRTTLSVRRGRPGHDPDLESMLFQLAGENPDVMADVAFALGERDLQTGGPDRALARLNRLQSSIERLKADPNLQILRARAALAKHDTDAAEAAALIAFQSSSAERNRPGQAEALRVQGTVRAQQGRLDEAQRLLGAALSLARGMPYPYLEAQTLLDLANVSIAQGNTVPAVALLKDALAIFRRLGATLAERSTLEILQGLEP